MISFSYKYRFLSNKYSGTSCAARVAAAAREVQRNYSNILHQFQTRTLAGTAILLL